MDSGILAPAHHAALASLAGDLARLEATVEAWEQGPRDTVRAYRQAIDALHAEALRRLVRTLRGWSGAAEALREAAADDVVYAVLRHHGIVKPSIAERVEAALESIRPLLAGHGGNVELVGVEPPAVTVRFMGACDNCPASTLTIDAAIKTAVHAACPEITDIVQVKDAASAHGADLPKGDGRPWLPAGMVQDIPEGGIRAANLDGHAVILSRVGDAVACFDDACVHLGAALHDGETENGILTCPWHGFRFDLRTGECETAPGVALPAHETRVVAGRVLVRLGG
jgi:nitrite reductase/ring-hydroxylating ferredoxin subunit/Fe-S cluster biogenesis protein NfuA